VKVAFVPAFYGAKAAGGAEAECRHTALHLAGRGVEVDILTTCLLDLQHDWNIDAHPAGISKDGPITVRRFRTDHVDRLAFDRLNAPLMRNEEISRDDGERFASLHINSPDLYRYLDQHADDYAWVCFIPYLFGTTLFGSRLRPDRSVLIPCLHDEGYARIQPVKDLFNRVARIVFHTEAERQLAAHLYGDSGSRGMVIGEGVETHLASDAGRFKKTYNIHDPFVLYCGRKDQSKNTPQLVDYFTRYKATHNSPLKLVMIGPGTAAIPPGGKDHIIDLGFIPYQDKLDAYAASEVFCQPSRNESFSIVLMEAWDLGKPALVHEDCPVLRDHVVEAGGGLYFRSSADFALALDYLINHSDTAAAMGAAGRRYVRSHYSWNHIIDRYINEVFAG